MNFAKNRAGRFMVGAAVVAAIAMYNNTDMARQNQIYYGSVQLGTTLQFEAPSQGELLAVVLKTKNRQDLKYNVKGPDGSELFSGADAMGSKRRRFSFRTNQSGPHTLQIAYDCTDCSPGIGYATADIHKTQRR